MTCIQCDRPVFQAKLCSLHYFRKRRGTDPSKPPRTEPGHATQLAVRCSTEQLGAWQRAAKRAKQSLRDWMRRTLDKEAGK